MKTVGIIGFGNFGQFAASHLKEHLDVSVSDAHDVSIAAKKIGVKAVSLEQAASCDIVILAVPVQQMETILSQIKPHVKPDAIVIDVASVKQRPAALMEAILPKSVQLIGTHPLFGPQSGKDGLKGLQIALCPIRADANTVVKTRAFLSELGLEVIDMTPSKHDQWMARTQAVAHLVGRAAKEMDLPAAPFKLATYDALLALRNLVKDDSDALFETIQNENPDAASQREKLERKMLEIESRLADSKAKKEETRAVQSKESNPAKTQKIKPPLSKPVKKKQA
ncbi:prephenate dehydrogenase [Candidatus Micrarchaeota archaeon]|nr:prephenate dehydrogenase [Candidatus Micrarchaeota archaeon]